MRHLKLLIPLALIVVALAVPSLLFLMRPPVLVVTDAPFAALYGASHLKQQQRSASLTLFRRVKPVIIADGASPDITLAAIAGASGRPLCVLFPRSQAQAALLFHEQFPETPAVVLSGLVNIPEIPNPDGFLCVYGTDRETDLYRAGLCAGILGGAYGETAGVQQKPALQPEKEEAPAKARRDRGSPPDEKQENPAANSPDSGQPPQPTPKTYVLWQDRLVPAEGKELFTGGVKENDPESVIVFARSAAEMPDAKGIACAVLSAAGVEYLEKNPKMPLILFSWLDPALASKELVVLFDDSIWALAVPAVYMAVQRQAEGKIPSKPLIFSQKIGDNSVYRVLKKSAKKVPLKDI